MSETVLMTRSAYDKKKIELDRLENEDLTVLGLRFHEDPLVPKERFDTLERELGARFERIELQPEDAAKPEGNPMAPHSVLTVHLDDADPEGPTRKVERRVIEFFSQRTGAATAAR